MEKCLDCNSTLKKEETECWSCGHPVARADTHAKMGGRFGMVINFFFILSAVMTVASLFFDATPPFTRCITATLVLFLVKSSMGQMLQKNEKD
jgi:hypothetical protein